MEPGATVHSGRMAGLLDGARARLRARADDHARPTRSRPGSDAGRPSRREPAQALSCRTHEALSDPARLRGRPPRRRSAFPLRRRRLRASRPALGSSRRPSPRRPNHLPKPDRQCTPRTPTANAADPLSAHARPPTGHGASQPSSNRYPRCAESSTRDASLLCNWLPKHSATWLAPLASLVSSIRSTESEELGEEVRQIRPEFPSDDAEATSKRVAYLAAQARIGAT